MKLVFYGDSLTSGENNSFISYVDKLRDKFPSNEIIKFGVSGTTTGEYSLYPVEGDSLISQLHRTVLTFKDCDLIFLEYGINDVSAIVCGKTSLTNVLLEFRKCVDFIRQNNSRCKIIFLTVADVSLMSELQYKYLSEDYLADVRDLVYIDYSSWSKIYISICSFAKKLCDYVFELYPVGLDMRNFMDTDNLHPNDAGYDEISKHIELLISKFES